MCSYYTLLYSVEEPKKSGTDIVVVVTLLLHCCYIAVSLIFCSQHEVMKIRDHPDYKEFFKLKRLVGVLRVHVLRFHSNWSVTKGSQSLTNTNENES